MRIQEFIKQPISLESTEQTIQKVWLDFKKKNRWPNTPLRISREILIATTREQEKTERISQDEIPGYSLEDNIRKIGTQWNWKKSPAPLQLLQGKKLWEGIRNNLQIGVEEQKESTKETLDAALRWGKNQIDSRRSEWQNITGPTGILIRQRILKEIKEAAEALGKLEDLSNSQKLEWNSQLKALTDKI